MTVRAISPSKRFNAYHQDNALLFQFILSEFLLSYEKILQLRTLQPLRDETANFDSINQLKVPLIALAGTNINYAQAFVWNSDDGLLAKLRNYCTYFMHNRDNQDKNASALHNAVHQAYLLCIHSLELMRTIEGSASSTKSKSFSALWSSLDKILNYMKKAEVKITQIAYQLRKNENVIFFMIRHHAQYESLFGTHYLPKFLKKCYPKGLHQMATFLSKKYAARGFDYLLPLIASKISELEVS